MDNFIVSARKYRPATFDTVVGQTAITMTLKNAIRSKHIAQAFLFCGPRGVGKTTCARILAKTINCENSTDNIEACDTCPSCKSFNEGHSLNIYELDAASNNSVEDIRSLIEQVRIAPQLGTHKVYIIDEVHMLSAAAFNAFLKTLEEPPAHAIFILATTSKNKIIPTILSRCQIFDFKRIQVQDIAQHLQFIAKQENIQAEPDALHIIAQKADGALRDALSIFDRIVSFTGKEITYKAVIDNLNVLDYDYYFKTTDAVLQSNISDVLLIFNEILNNGFDGHNYITGLGEHFRNILVCKDAVTIQLLEVGEKIKERYKNQSAQCTSSFLLQALNITNKCDITYKESKNQRLLVELTLMQLCTILMENKKENKEDTPQIIVKKSTEIKKAVVSTNIYGKETTSHESKPIVTQVSEPVQPLKTKGFSINEMLQVSDNKETREKDLNVHKRNTPFEMEQLKEVWEQFAERIKKQGKSNFYTMLTAFTPIIKENNIIELPIENTVQDELFNEEKTEFLTFLRNKLLNDTIQLELSIKKPESQRKPYTIREKYKRMVEKNPNLDKLREQLDLEIEF